jgi:SAM-dependent methyltransferase
MRKPFVDYYRANAISPVSQDLSDIALHLERRESLYLALGILPALVAGRSVVEFGPGSGHNAIYTSSLRPRRYVLVDGNPVGLTSTGELLDRHAPQRDACTLVESLFEAFETEERFDLVLCEGAIAGQVDPARFARKIGGFAADGGVFVMTSQDAASSLGELLRRVVAAHVVPRTLPVREQVERLVPVFATHTATLEGMTRPVEDWVLDNIIQPYVGNMFSVVEAIEALGGDGFEVYNASPRFFTVWRWYKRQVGTGRDIGPAVSAAYCANIVNIMDHRLDGTAIHSAELGKRVLLLADRFYALLRSAESGTGYAPVLETLREVAETVRPVSALTATSVDEALAMCEAAGAQRPLPEAPAFRGFFGHGQQYLSFVRRA